MKTPYLLIALMLSLAACSTSSKNMNADLNRKYNKKMDGINIATYKIGSSTEGAFEDPELFFNILANEADYSKNQLALIDFGRQYLGTTYVYGATNPGEGFDCSGFTQFAFKKALNLNLPRTAKQMAGTGMEVPSNQLIAGDLVFFNTRGFDFSHVGIYIGEGKFFHASTKLNALIIGDMNGQYFSSRYNGARRVMFDNNNFAGNAPTPSI